MARKLNWLGWALVSASAVVAAGCATTTTGKIQSPYDGFVCFDTSFNACLGKVQQGQVQQYTTKTFSTGRRQILALGSPDDGKIPTTSDKKYECRYGTVPYQSALQRDQAASVVFVSPVLLRHIGEQQLRLDKIRSSCARIIETYESQLEVLRMQDQISLQQGAIALFSGEIEGARNAKEGYGGRKVTSDEKTTYGVPDSTLAEALAYERAQLVKSGETLRSQLKKQAMDVDFKRQFEDANLSIELQLRDIARNLFILDRAVVQAQPGARPDGYADGAWVRQGTIVVKHRPDRVR